MFGRMLGQMRQAVVVYGSEPGQRAENDIAGLDPDAAAADRALLGLADRSHCGAAEGSEHHPTIGASRR